VKKTDPNRHDGKSDSTTAALTRTRSRPSLVNMEGPLQLGPALVAITWSPAPNDGAVEAGSANEFGPTPNYVSVSLRTSVWLWPAGVNLS
jgi:hypothetical protein